jgi:hypothetical protein
MAAKFRFTKGLYCVVISFKTYVVQNATRSQLKLKDDDIIVKLSRGEICVANLEAHLRMVIVWVVNESEKTA